MNPHSCKGRSPGVVHAIGIVLIAGVVCEQIDVVHCVAAPPAAASRPKRARPPKFPKSIEDVFFPDARTKLVGPRPEPAAAGAPLTAATPSRPAETTPAAGSARQWPKWIESDAIEDEIKSQARKLSASVLSPTAFKGGGYQQARLHLGMLATMFAIDAEYGQRMRWQREAPALRDLTARAAANCKVGTDGSYREAKQVAEELESLVRGGSLQAKAGSGERAWAKVADRSLLMKRIEEAHDGVLVPLTANANDFSQGADRLAHEAQLVAALAEVIQDKGYEYADDDAYLELARAMQTQAVAARNAVAQKSYDQARQAVSEAGKACASCHEGYRN